jgi:vancomycin resistance protein YoaR
VEVAATLAGALAAGEAKGVFDAVALWLRGGARALPLVVAIDEAALDALADEWEPQLVDDPPFDGGVAIEGGRPVAQPPRPGTGIDRAALRERVVDALARAAAEPIEVPRHRVEPRLDAAAVEAAVERARTIVSNPVVLVREAPAANEPEPPRKKTSKRRKKKDREDEADAGGPIEVAFDTETLAAALRTRTDLAPSPRLVVELDPLGLAPVLERVAKKLEDPARDARFTVDERDRVTIEPSRDGTRVDPAKVAEAIVRAASTPDRRGPLPIEHGARPALTTEDAQALGIRGLVSSFTTHFVCCQPRVKNIRRIAELIDGVVVKPGDRFSVNDFVGPRTRERGFVPAPSIEDGEMVDTVGGGVSQFATTFYNALLDGGYAIVERKPHSYYFSRYPMGHEATLSFPKPDLVFRNDTGAGVLIKVDVGKTAIKVRLFGDNGGRRVERKVSSRFDVKEPPDELVANDAIDPEEEEVKEPGQPGWSLDVGRVVTFADGTTKKEERRVRYRARPRVVEVHSCKIPKGEKGYTGKKCPEPPEDEETELAEAAEVEGGEAAPSGDTTDPFASPR